jgi:hypothetical protein
MAHQRACGAGYGPAKEGTGGAEPADGISDGQRAVITKEGLKKPSLQQPGMCGAASVPPSSRRPATDGVTRGGERVHRRTRGGVRRARRRA